MYRIKYNLFLVILLLSLLEALWIGMLVNTSQLSRLNENTVTGDEFRCQYVGESMLTTLRDSDNPGKTAGVYLLESNFGYDTFSGKHDAFAKKWSRKKEWEPYLQWMEAIWNDVKFFPVPESGTRPKLGVSYVDSWMYERSYGGPRGHEGTDIMAKEQKAGLYPVLSMTDGVITKKGWLEKGGYRIGVESPRGAYFYYAHLDSYADLNVGDEVKAGDILGYMGDSGYGPEGTTGKFDVHLHLGIYIYPEEKEMSINPYWVLRYIENRKVKCYTKE